MAEVRRSGPMPEGTAGIQGIRSRHLVIRRELDEGASFSWRVPPLPCSAFWNLEWWCDADTMRIRCGYDADTMRIRCCIVLPSLLSVVDSDLPLARCPSA